MGIIRLGSEVKDTLTGFRGIAVCRTTWLHGCARIGIQPQETKDGKVLEIEHLDEPRIKVIKEPEEGAFGMPTEDDRASGRVTGGPQKDEGRFNIPKR